MATDRNGQSQSNENLVRVAEKSLEKGEIEYALRLYELAGVSPPEKLLVNFADRCINLGDLKNALVAYRSFRPNVD